MHGRRKWIVRYDGRLKRSNDRTKKDRAGDFARRHHWRPCAACEELYALRNCQYGWCVRCEQAFTYGPYSWGRDDRIWENYFSSWCGRIENQFYRAEVRNLMRRGQYDDLPLPRKTVRWNYG